MSTWHIPAETNRSPEERITFLRSDKNAKEVLLGGRSIRREEGFAQWVWIKESGSDDHDRKVAIMKLVWERASRYQQITSAMRVGYPYK
jgi:hypothetical protein